MKILSLATDGAGRAHLAAIRAPDLWRRHIAAQTGEAHLVFVAVPPAGLSVDDLLARLDARLAKSGAAPATIACFANAPTRILEADPQQIARWLRREIERASRPANLSVRVLLTVRRTLRRRVWRLLAAVRLACGCGIACRRMLAAGVFGRGLL